MASSHCLFGPHHVWKVPLILLLEADEAVYVNLVRSLDGESIVPRQFFELPVVSRLDSVFIAPVSERWPLMLGANTM